MGKTSVSLLRNQNERSRCMPGRIRSKGFAPLECRINIGSGPSLRPTRCSNPQRRYRLDSCSRQREAGVVDFRAVNYAKQQPRKIRRGTRLSTTPLSLSSFLSPCLSCPPSPPLRPSSRSVIDQSILSNKPNCGGWGTYPVLQVGGDAGATQADGDVVVVVVIISIS